MNRKEQFVKMAETVIPETLPNEDLSALLKSISRLMMWAYVKGVDAGIETAETEMKNAV